MKREIRKYVGIVGMALLIGTGLVQFVLAFVWAIRNGNNIQDFYDTQFFFANIANNSHNGWNLMGYSYILSAFMKLQGICRENYVVFLYLFQCVISVLCFGSTIKICLKKIAKIRTTFVLSIVGGIWITTIPIIWQMQFSVLPDALCLAILVLSFGQIYELLYNTQRFRWDCILIIAGGMILLGLMQHHYFYADIALCVFLLLILLFRNLFRKYRNRKVLFASALILLCIIGAVWITPKLNKEREDVNCYAHYSIEADLISRFVFPYLAETYPEYPENVQAIFSEDVAKICDEYYVYIMNSICVMIEGKAGIVDAKEIYAQMVQTGFEYREDYHRKEIAKELTAYTFMPLAMEKYMYLNGNSLYGHNYTKMWEKDADITNRYMHISMNGFFAVTVWGFTVVLLTLVLNKNKRGNIIKNSVFLFLSALCAAFPMMILSVAAFDYRIGLFSTFIWGMISFICVIKFVTGYRR